MGGSSKQSSSSNQSDKSTNLQFMGETTAPVVTGNNNDITYTDHNAMNTAAAMAETNAQLLSDTSADNLAAIEGAQQLTSELGAQNLDATLGAQDLVNNINADNTDFLSTANADNLEATLGAQDLVNNINADNTDFLSAASADNLEATLGAQDLASTLAAGNNSTLETMSADSAELLGTISGDNHGLLTTISNNQTDVALKQSELTMDTATGLFADATDLMLETNGANADALVALGETYADTGAEVALASMQNGSDLSKFAIGEIADANAGVLDLSAVAMDNNTDLSIAFADAQVANNAESFAVVDNTMQRAFAQIGDANASMEDLSSAAIAQAGANLTGGFNLAQSLSEDSTELQAFTTKTLAETISENSENTLAQLNAGMTSAYQFAENASRSDGAAVLSETGRNNTIMLSVAIGGAVLIGLAMILKKKG